MTYGNACNNCARIPYWSNPNVNHPITNQPMGTSSEHNNARVLNITQYDVRDFRTLSPPQSFIITNRYSYNQSPHFTWRSEERRVGKSVELGGGRTFKKESIKVKK